jgi:uncharacterized membrane protein YkgB
MALAMKPVTDTKKEDVTTLGMRQGISGREMSIELLQLRFSDLDNLFITFLRRWSIPALRVAIGVIFIWFGVLKLLGVSPVLSLVQKTYSFLPLHVFFLVLSIWEMGIGCGLIFKRALRCTLLLLCMHLMGTFIALLQAPSLFFMNNNPLLLTTEGEFVMKNLVLVASALVIGGYEVRPRARASRMRMVHNE